MAAPTLAAAFHGRDTSRGFSICSIGLKTESRMLSGLWKWFSVSGHVSRTRGQPSCILLSEVASPALQGGCSKALAYVYDVPIFWACAVRSLGAFAKPFAPRGLED